MCAAYEFDDHLKMAVYALDTVVIQLVSLLQVTGQPQESRWLSFACQLQPSFPISRRKGQTFLFGLPSRRVSTDD
jgi:hypothetical protein